MGNSLAVNPVGIAPAAIDRAGSGSAAAPQPLASSATPASAVASAPVSNPMLRVDPTLNLVVMEFYNTAGSMVQSIPSQQQLATYHALNATSATPPAAGSGAAAGQNNLA
jgi:hypothetical protein